MAITVLVREPLRSRLGASQFALDPPTEGTLGALIDSFAARYPAAGNADDLRKQNEFFVGDVYVPRGEIVSRPLRDGDTVLIAIDVAGG
jgi:molybdopterin converting factor small subunit